MNPVDSYILSRKRKEMEEEYLRQALYSSMMMSPGFSSASSYSATLGPFLGTSFVPSYSRLDAQNKGYSNTSMTGNVNAARYSNDTNRSVSSTYSTSTVFRYSSRASASMSYVPVIESMGNKNYKSLASTYTTWQKAGSTSAKSQPLKGSTSQTGAGKGK